jgi:hypothetical protein
MQGLTEKWIKLKDMHSGAERPIRLDEAFRIVKKK